MAGVAPDTTVGAVHLTVADLDRSLAYYEQAIGLRTRACDNGVASLGAGGDDLLVLYEEPGAKPAPRHTGLFHFALVLPERRPLAAFLAHAAREGAELTGLSDHFVSEAIYLRDPDHHGIEIYRDRPREEWYDAGGRFRFGTVPLDVDDLLKTLNDPASEPFDGLPAGTRMGHVHLQVARIPETIGFYRDVLGMDLMAQLGEQAAFLSAGGYHHHVGGNTWAGIGATPPPPGSAGLRDFAIVLPDPAERDRVAERVAATGQEPEERADGLMVSDPAANRVLLAAAAASPRSAATAG